jgi:hypothetical protein
VAAIVMGSVNAVCAEPAPPAAPPAAASPAKEEPIAAAKREFQGVKSARDAAMQPDGRVPRIAVPELSTGAPPAAPTLQQRTAAPEQKSANWLVDAMEKRPDGRRDAGLEQTRGGRVTPPRERDVNAATGGDEPGAAVARDQALERERKENAAALNPLTRYLGDWMTPQDYALLKPGLQPSMAGGEPRTSGATLPFGVSSPVSPLPGAETAFGLVPPTLPASTPAAPRVNPYLQSLTPAAAPAVFTPTASTVSPPSAPAPAPVTVTSPPTVPAQSGSKVPEFAKPGSDARYFKQLKRF